jgi:hypothetical protein
LAERLQNQESAQVPVYAFAFVYKFINFLTSAIWINSLIGDWPGEAGVDITVWEGMM